MSLEIWGDQWSLLIIRDLMYNKQLAYGDFLKSAEKIATNTLATRLQFLEESKVIERFPNPERGSQLLYRLTPMGVDLVPAMMEISLWADKYFTIAGDRRAMLAEVRKDKEGFIERVIKKLNSR